MVPVHFVDEWPSDASLSVWNSDGIIRSAEAIASSIRTPKAMALCKHPRLGIFSSHALAPGRLRKDRRGMHRNAAIVIKSVQGLCYVISTT